MFPSSVERSMHIHANSCHCVYHSVDCQGLCSVSHDSSTIVHMCLCYKIPIQLIYPIIQYFLAAVRSERDRRWSGELVCAGRGHVVGMSLRRNSRRNWASISSVATQHLLIGRTSAGTWAVHTQFQRTNFQPGSNLINPDCGRPSWRWVKTSCLPVYVVVIYIFLHANMRKTPIVASVTICYS